MDEHVQESAKESNEALDLARRAKNTQKSIAKKLRYYVESEELQPEGRDLENRNSVETERFQCTKCNESFSTKFNLKRHKNGRW